MGKRQSYTDEDREKAVAAWLANGECLRKTSRAIGIPVQTIHKWRHERGEWWEQTAQRLREQYEAEYRAAIREIIVSGLGEMRDRVQNGDEKIDTKTGEFRRVRMSGRDLAIVTGTMYDKLRISLGQPTSIAGKAETTSGDKLAALKEMARKEAIESGQVAELLPEKTNQAG